MHLFDILQDGYHTPLTAAQIADLFHAGRLDRHTPCKPVAKKEWRTLDELFPLLKYDNKSPRFADPSLHSSREDSLRQSTVDFLKSLVPSLFGGAATSVGRDTTLPIHSTPRKVIQPRPPQLPPPLPNAIAPPVPKPVPTLDSLSWENFELLIGEVYRRKGYAVEISSGLGADGGKDLTLRKNNQLVVVQCKKLAQDHRVTAGQMREFFGLITAEGAARGFFVTTGYFSADATKFAAGKPIDLIERAEVESLVTEVSAAGENLYNISSWIKTFASRAKVADPVCPFCENPMKLIRGVFGKPFWGCTRYRTHRCRGKRHSRQELARALR
jgi:hypothetical protein